MSTNFYPRVETIVVPTNIPADDIGKYVSSRAGDILTELGIGAYHPRSVWLKPVNERLFVLGFDSHVVVKYVEPKKEELHTRDDSRQEFSVVVEGASEDIRTGRGSDTIRIKKTPVRAK